MLPLLQEQVRPDIRRRGMFRIEPQRLVQILARLLRLAKLQMHRGPHEIKHRHAVAEAFGLVRSSSERVNSLVWNKATP